MRAFHRIPLTKFLAVTTALTCTGGGMLIGRAGSAAGAALSAPVAGDHYLCVRTHGHATCDPAAVTFADGSSVGVGDPNDRLVCDPSRRVRPARFTAPVTHNVVNEFSPAGPVAVPLEEGHFHSTCTVTPIQLAAQSRVRTLATPLPQYSCTSVHYPWRATVRFSAQFPVTANGHTLYVFDPSRLCVPVTPPGGVQAAVAGPNELLCFRARGVDGRRRFNGSRFRLCVPSTEGANAPTGTPAPTGSSTSTPAPTSTSTTATSSTTTTTRPPTTTTGAPTTTTTRPSTSTTTSSTTSTTTTTIAPPTSQPCPGVIIQGNCIITV